MFMGPTLHQQNNAPEIFDYGGHFTVPVLKVPLY